MYSHGASFSLGGLGDGLRGVLRGRENDLHTTVVLEGRCPSVFCRDGMAYAAADVLDTRAIG